MDQKVRIFFFSLILLVAGFSSINAAPKGSIDSPNLQSEPSLEMEEAANILTSCSDNKLSEKENLFYDSFINGIEFYNFQCQNKYSNDSINMEYTRDYIYSILPILKKIDSRKIEMIEIL